MTTLDGRCTCCGSTAVTSGGCLVCDASRTLCGCGAILRCGCGRAHDKHVCPMSSEPCRPLGFEAQSGHRVLVGPDPDGQGGSFGVVMGDEVRVVSTNQVGKLIRYRLGSHDDRVVVLVDGEAVETRSHDVLPRLS